MRRSAPAWPLPLVSLILLSTCEAPGNFADAPAEIESSGQALTSGAAVLFVVGSTTLSPADTALRNRLQTLGASVTVKAATAAQTSDGIGKKLIAIADSVGASDVNTKFRDSTAPVLVLKSSVLDDMNMVGPTSGADYGTIASQTQLGLAAVSHTVAAGLTVAVTSSAQTFTWGKPAATATVVATVAGNGNRSAVFLYERKSTMVGMIAPGRRAGFFAAGTSATALTSNGWRLFDNVVEWLAAQTACSSNADCPSIPNASATCSNGQCTLACNAGFQMCGGACVTPNSPTACGPSCTVCATPPNAAPICSNGQCSFQCNTGFINCGGTCVQGTSCTGGCTSNAQCPGIPNGTGICSNGQCSFQCNTGFINCGGTCVQGTSCTDSLFNIPGSAVTASGDDGNVPANTVDGNLSTRWSSSGDGQWIRYDVGASRRIAFVRVAFYNGASRTFTFDIQTSSDGVNFTTIRAGVVSAQNNDMQTFEFSDATARYVRLLGHGNSSSAWNSYTEVQIWGG
jgi:F5/8 type C domain